MTGTAELSTGQRIMASSWRVCVPRIYVDDMDLERYRGTVMTGSDQANNFGAYRPRVVDMSIARMAEIYQQGVKPTFQKPSEQSPAIYKLLLEHLRLGIAYYQNGFLSGPDSEELFYDLQVLDEFAAWVYKVARKYMNNDDDILHESLVKRGRERYSPMSRGPAKVMDDLLPEEHKSITEPIVERTFSGSGNGRGWIG